MTCDKEEELDLAMEQLADGIRREVEKNSREMVLIAPGRIDALVAEAEARGVLKERARAAAERCNWTESGIGEWESGCGEEFVFTDGGPGNSGFAWCPYCGKALAIAPDPDALYNGDSGEVER